MSDDHKPDTEGSPPPQPQTPEEVGKALQESRKGMVVLPTDGAAPQAFQEIVNEISGSGTAQPDPGPTSSVPDSPSDE